AALDEHHRVVGNALVGLYLCGRTDVVWRLKDMSRRPEEIFRRAAAWAMGSTGDPRFLQRLDELRLDADRGVLGAALKAIQAIRRNRANLSEVRVEISRAEWNESRKLRVEMTVDDATQPDFSPLAFCVRADGRQSDHFLVTHSRDGHAGRYVATCEDI